MNSIDVTFDFTTDTPGFWDHFWENNNGLGAGIADPDSANPTLQEYQRLLWSKELPNGDRMDLQKGCGSNYLSWNGFRFGSDSIMVSFRYKKYRWMIEQVAKAVPDYKAFVEDYIRKFYTIGGDIIFPKRMWGMNRSRGCNYYISDRWDLTLECIRRYYAGEGNPLQKVMESDRAFYDLFLDFKGYVDFFLLQDCVSDDYSKVDIWIGEASFDKSGLPETVNEYFSFIEKEHEFLDKRNRRIQKYCVEHDM